jgi:hypothetical protein
MMNKLKTAKLHLVRFLFILPLLAVILLSFRKQIGDSFSQNKNKEKVLNNIGKILNEDRILFLSEECFLLENSSMSWREKIKNLYEYFHSYNPMLLLTVRNPKDAMISFYVEIYHGLPAYYKKNFRFFFESEYCDIYKYNKLISHLELLNFKVNIIEFEGMTNGKYYCSNFFQRSFTNDCRIFLEKKNATLIDKGKCHAKSRTIRDLFRSKIIANFVNTNIWKRYSRGRGISEKLISMIPDFNLPSKKINFNFDEYDYTEFINEYNSIVNRIY